MTNTNERDTRRPMERFFPSRVIKSLQGPFDQLHFDEFFQKKLSIVIMTTTMDEKLQNVMNQCTLDRETSN